MELRATAGGPGRARGVARRIADVERTGSSATGDVVVGPAHAVVAAVDAGASFVAAVIAADAPEASERALALPWVRFADADVLGQGEELVLDGDSGRIDLSGVEPVRVVTAFLQRDDGSVLLLRRSESVGSFRGRWAAVSGFLEDPTPLAQARREVREETGIDLADVVPDRAAPPVYARDAGRIFEVHAFRFRVAAPAVRLDWEHTEYEWVAPSELERRPTVPKLGRAWRALEDARSEPAARPKGV